jgi:hypothetical protein
MLWYISRPGSLSKSQWEGRREDQRAQQASPNDHTDVIKPHLDTCPHRSYGGSSITNEAVDKLKLKKGEKAYAVIKATDVMVGLD